MKQLILLFFCIHCQNIFASGDRALGCNTCVLINGFKKNEVKQIINILKQKELKLTIFIEKHISELYRCQEDERNHQSFYITTRGGISPLTQIDWALKQTPVFEYHQISRGADHASALLVQSRLQSLPNCPNWVSGAIDYVPRPHEF